jgi:predicted DNA-binding transcriptional regulator AlpA
MAAKLVGPAEIARMLGGISRQRVYQLTSRDDFPAPVAALATGKIWAYEDVIAFAKRTGRTVTPLAEN